MELQVLLIPVSRVTQQIKHTEEEIAGAGKLWAELPEGEKSDIEALQKDINTLKSFIKDEGKRVQVEGQMFLKATAEEADFWGWCDFS